MSDFLFVIVSTPDTTELFFNRSMMEYIRSFFGIGIEKKTVFRIDTDAIDWEEDNYCETFFNLLSASWYGCRGGRTMLR